MNVGVPAVAAAFSHPCKTEKKPAERTAETQSEKLEKNILFPSSLLDCRCYENELTFSKLKFHF